jgi:hypothetical protein
MALGRIERLQIMLTEDELAAIDDWRFARRMPSRAAAIREIVKRGGRRGSYGRRQRRKVKGLRNSRQAES